MPGQQSEIPAMTKMEAQQAKHEVVEDYETRVPHSAVLKFDVSFLSSVDSSQ
ncbi:hypothetical protein Bca4012_071328 [Brassica carinata]|uniref:Uncharacterized protein n=2 Tax=Brassica TaxID=3705 RepID=A0A3P6FK58_BRAOL|nr:unnamed protein product [Brassica napus]CDY38248.1 BnaC05g17650D [Brassica napus]VDD43269.1 unnamed protein product [Brassica oleracea]